MKDCPQCRIEYFDDTLKFCLEDRTRFVSSPITVGEFPTIAKSDKKKSLTNASTERIGASETPNLVALSGSVQFGIPKTVEQIKSKIPGKIVEGIHDQEPRVLEKSSLVRALINN